MRRLLAALGLIRPCGSIEIILPPSENAGGFTIGGPYFTSTAEGMAGPFWPAVLGPTPGGYLMEPSDSIKTFGDGASATLFMFDSVKDPSERGEKE